MADTCEYMIRVKGNLFRCFAVVGARNAERIVDINKKMVKSFLKVNENGI